LSSGRSSPRSRSSLAVFNVLDTRPRFVVRAYLESGILLIVLAAAGEKNRNAEKATTAKIAFM
jgi:hypothetical protein